MGGREPCGREVVAGCEWDADLEVTGGEHSRGGRREGCRSNVILFHQGDEGSAS